MFRNVRFRLLQNVTADQLVPSGANVCDEVDASSEPDKSVIPYVPGVRKAPKDKVKLSSLLICKLQFIVCIYSNLLFLFIKMLCYVHKLHSNDVFSDVIVNIIYVCTICKFTFFTLLIDYVANARHLDQHPKVARR